MIQDTAWSPRFVPSTTATAATSGEAIAGTDTTKFITPSLLPAATSYHAGPVVNGRAPRQGLVLDGSNSGSATMGSSIGDSSATVDLLLDIPSSNPATSRGVFTIGPNSVSANYANTFHAELRTDGKLWVNLSGSTTNDYRRVESSSSLVSLFGGKRVRLTVVRDSSAATLAVYVNAVALATTETTGGTAPAWSGNVTGTYFVPGRISASEIHVGYHSLVGFYNRALSTSEVVALYEAGAPSGADYNSASNTAINTSTAVDGVAGNNTFAATAGGSFTGASATGFTAVSGGGAYAAASFQPNFTVQPGQIIRVTYTATVNSGTVVASLMNSSVSSISASHTVTTGTRTVEFVATAASTSARVIFGSSGGGACNFSVSSVSVVRSGLLLAPDAAQAGGGLVWYDTSGNAANITLPASGVSWNVPSSSVLGGNWTTSGNLTVSGTGTSALTSSSANLVVGSTTATSTNAVGVPQITTESDLYSSICSMAHNNTNGNHGFLMVGKSRGTKASPTILADGDVFGELAFVAYDGAAYRTAGQIRSVIAGTPGATDLPCALDFRVAPDGSSTPAPAMRIAPTGNLLLGGTADGGQKLQVNGDATFAGDRVINRKDQNGPTRLQARNDTSGTAAGSQVAATLGDFTTYTAMGSLSAGFTTLGLFVANTGYIASNATAGLNLFTVGATSLTLGTNNTTALTLASTGAATFAGAVTATGGIVGVTTNSNAAAGNVGEIVTAVVDSGSGVSLTSTVVANATSISLTAGDWDVTGVVGYDTSGATVSQFLQGLNNASAAIGPTGAFSKVAQSLSGDTNNWYHMVPTYRFSLSATSTVYLLARATFSAGTVAAFGAIRARRVR